MKIYMLLTFALVSFVFAHDRAESTPHRTDDGFKVPRPGPTFVFPRDHGSHPDYKIEWWYLTGHLEAAKIDDTAGRRFGFQATFFRSAAPSASAARPGTPAFGHDQIYLAHMALIDIATGRFYYQERLNRSGWNASASTTTLDVRNGDWSLRLLDEKSEAMQVRGGIGGDVRFALHLRPLKPLVKFGEGGYSRKGDSPTAASYYLTFSRLEASGELIVAGEHLKVEGLAWMDHEYSSSQLDDDQVGWDWLSAQLHDGREIMFYALRRRDGSLDPASRLTWIDKSGALRTSDYRWEALSFWTSPRTGARYPQRVRLTSTDPFTGQSRRLMIVPHHAEQELAGEVGGVAYWEGACRILDESGSEIGAAYMELTGYDKPVDLVR